ncbi:DUF4913 domain-containing protein [Nocardia sp. NPDC058518]|uniref:DUF4913 domain-containing protein n=1 Tax=Nocardia sp. NPDC058518 TaxID=3346534 RepID=UPI003658E7BA
MTSNHIDLGLDPDVEDQFVKLADKRGRPALRELFSGLYDRAIAQALDHSDNADIARQLSDVADAAAAQWVKELRKPDGGPTDKLIFDNLEQFCTQFFFELYARDTTYSNAIKWCCDWWAHPEAQVRLEAIWRAWEQLRRDGGTGMSTFMRDHADHHMAKLFDPEGPFKYCSADGHESDEEGRVKALAHTPAPTGLFARPTTNQP